MELSTIVLASIVVPLVIFITLAIYATVKAKNRYDEEIMNESAFPNEPVETEEPLMLKPVVKEAPYKLDPPPVIHLDKIPAKKKVASVKKPAKTATTVKKPAAKKPKQL